MHANSMCISCLISKQEMQIRHFEDEAKKSRYLHRILQLLYEYGQTESTPWLAERMNRLYQEFWGALENYDAVKHTFNQLLLTQESRIETQIRQASDCLKECISYVCAGNYIDFSAVGDVNETMLEHLLEKAAGERISEEEYQAFCSDLAQAGKLVYLTDNCGEIVLDKLFIKFIRETYPQLQITAIVRGEPVINDATLADAEEVGLTGLVPCIGNGNGAPGTVVKRFSAEARQALKAADVIISKGQGNFEGLFGEGYNPYYLFLCKCDLFVRRFGLARYQSVFRKEERVRLT